MNLFEERGKGFGFFAATASLEGETMSLTGAELAVSSFAFSLSFV
jgi:hypothetical protein